MFDRVQALGAYSYVGRQLARGPSLLLTPEFGPVGHIVQGKECDGDVKVTAIGTPTLAQQKQLAMIC